MRSTIGSRYLALAMTLACTPGGVETDSGTTSENSSDSDSETVNETANETGAAPREPGAAVWNHLVDPPEGEAAAARGITVGGDGHLYIAGWIEGPESTHPSALLPNLDIFIRKLTRDGIEVWTLVHDTLISGYDRGFAIAPLDAESVVVVGQVQIDQGDVWVRAIGADASTLWTTTASGSNFADDAGLGVVTRADGSLVVAGRVYGAAPMSDDGVIWIRHLTSAGGELETAWVEAQGDPWHASAQAIGLHPDGSSVYAVGVRPFELAARIWVGRFGGALEPTWQATLSETAGIAHGVAVTYDGDPIVAGTTGSVATLGYVDGPSAAWIGRFHGGTGDVRWSLTRAETSHQQAHAITIDGAGEVIVVGEAGDAPGAGAAWIAKLDPSDGSEIWSVTDLVDDGASAARALGVTTDGDSKIYIAGTVVMADGERLWVQRREP